MPINLVVLSLVKLADAEAVGQARMVHPWKSARAEHMHVNDSAVHILCRVVAPVDARVGAEMKASPDSVISHVGVYVADLMRRKLSDMRAGRVKFVHFPELF